MAQTIPKAETVGSREACEMLGGIQRSTLTRWVASGRLEPAMRLPGKTGAYLFHRADIERLVGERAA